MDCQSDRFSQDQFRSCGRSDSDSGSCRSALPELSILCAVPGVNTRVAGDTVTPEGRPATLTVTLPVKLFTAVAVSATCDPEDPIVMDCVAGATDRVKCGAAATFSATAAKPVLEPLTPVSVRVAALAATLEVAVSVIVCAVPSAKLRTEGLAVMPVGRPVRVTATV